MSFTVYDTFTANTISISEDILFNLNISYDIAITIIRCSSEKTVHRVTHL